MQDEKQAFIAALEKDPYDTTTRRVFSDWLEEQGLDDEALEQRRMATQEWVEADQWMHSFAKACGDTDDNYPDKPKRWREITYEDVIQAGHDFVATEDYFCQMGSERARNLMHEQTKEAYWNNWKIITGQPGPAWNEMEPWHSTAPFTCSC